MEIYISVALAWWRGGEVGEVEGRQGEPRLG